MSEQNLIKCIFGKNINENKILLECKLKEQELKYQHRSPRMKIMILNIIKLLWGGNMFYIGDRLKNYKDLILNSLIEIYKNPLKAHILEKDFEKIEKYGVIMTMLINSKLLFNEYFYHFFEMFLLYGKVLEVLNKIFDKLGLYALFKHNLNIDELVDIINMSSCFQEGKFDYKKLNDYIYNKFNKESSKKENENNIKNSIINLEDENTENNNNSTNNIFNSKTNESEEKVPNAIKK